jgi:uncharacterized protein YjiS (DUF1127 family)
MKSEYGNCMTCQVELGHVDEDPNGDIGTKCARCLAEEEHDFDVLRDAEYDRSGNLIERIQNELATEKEQLRDERVVAILEDRRQKMYAAMTAIFEIEKTYPTDSWERRFAFRARCELGYLEDIILRDIGIRS